MPTKRDDLMGRNPSHPTRRNKWLSANCPVCGDELKYKPGYKPKTCTKGDCMRKYYHDMDRETWADPKA